jgi:hypothetical protein
LNIHLVNHNENDFVVLFFTFFTDILSQCSRMPNDANIATQAVCALLLDTSLHQPLSLPPMMDSLAALLSIHSSVLIFCLESRQSTALAMKKILVSISNTESRDPRDPAAIATIMLNLCHSSCRDSSIVTLLAMSIENMKTSRAAPYAVHKFCTSPFVALLWQHANNSPRECSDSMITYAASEYNVIGITACVLRSMLPVYVTMCDVKAIQCEEYLLSMTTAETQTCDQTIKENAACSIDCAAFVTKVSSDRKCMESSFSIQEVVSHVAQQTCADNSGKGFLVFLANKALWRLAYL